MAGTCLTFTKPGTGGRVTALFRNLPLCESTRRPLRVPIRTLVN